MRNKLDVKFYENCVSGQSKGFCCVSLGSEAFMLVLMEKMPKWEVHRQTPAVTYGTKQALMQFESQSKTRPVLEPPPPPTQMIISFYFFIIPGSAAA